MEPTASAYRHYLHPDDNFRDYYRLCYDNHSLFRDSNDDGPELCCYYD